MFFYVEASSILKQKNSFYTKTVNKHHKEKFPIPLSYIYAVI